MALLALLPQVTYDPSEATYEQLLDLFFARVDPTQKNRQVGTTSMQGLAVLTQQCECWSRHYRVGGSQAAWHVSREVRV